VNEKILEEKRRKLEALHARPGTTGEKAAAEDAIQRIKARLAEFRTKEVDVEYSFSLHDPWKRMLFVSLCRRYGLKPFRRYGQHRTTVMVNAPESFIEQTLWPEFQELAETLSDYLREITEKVIQESVHGDTSEEEVMAALQ